MATRKYSNNAASTLLTAITNSQTGLTTASGGGSLFPSLSGSDWFIATLANGATVEVVKVTARSSDYFTIVRSQEGTSAAAFPAGSAVELRATAASFSGLGIVAPGNLATGNLFYASNTTTVAPLAIGAVNQYLRVSGGLPTWSNLGTGVKRIESHEKLALDTVNASTVLTNATELSIAVSADASLFSRWWLIYTSNTTADIKFAFTVPTGCSLAWCPETGGRWASSGSWTLTGSIFASGQSLDFTGSGGGATFNTATLNLWASNGSTAGTINLQFAQNTSNASNTQLRLNSMLQVWRLV